VVLALDDDELRAATSVLSGVPPDTEVAASVAVGSVRLRARGLLAGSDLETNAAALLGTYLRPTDSLAVAIRRRSADAAALNLTFHRQGGRMVEHYRAVAGDGEWHSFEALAGLEQVIQRLVALLQATPTQSGAVFALDPVGLERARLAAAAGDRLDALAALRSAGADAALAEQLVAALSDAQTLAQLVHVRRAELQPLESSPVHVRRAELQPLESSPVHVRRAEVQPREGLTVLVASDGVWTFAQAGPEVSVARVSDAGLRERLLAVWAT
jgi:hypothetical protein